MRHGALAALDIVSEYYRASGAPQPREKCNILPGLQTTDTARSRSSATKATNTQERRSVCYKRVFPDISA